MHYKKIDKKYNLQSILIEMNHIISKHGWNENQISLQSLNGNDWHEGNGAIGDRKETDYTPLNISENWELTKFIKENNQKTRISSL